MTAPAPISHISDTARWVAVYRAMESERSDAIFRDPYARRLAGPRGEAIVRAMPKGAKMAWPMIVRTAVMDEILMRVIAAESIDCVLNLAAGLDARPWRLPLPPLLKWVDVDHPEMIDYKQGAMAEEKPLCRYEGVRLDLSDRPARTALFARIGTASRRVLVITEGLLVYLTRESVSELAMDLHDQASFRNWLLDLASPALLKYLEKTWGTSMAAAPFQFAPPESSAFFAPFGWREAEWRSQFHESIRLKRTFPMARFWNFITRFMSQRKREEFKRFSGILLLERSETH